MVAPETAAHAAGTSALLPMLALGIPGSPTAAVLLGGLLIWGLQPGPLLFVEQKDFVWGLIASMYLGNLAGLIVVLTCVPLFAAILRVPFSIIAPVIIVICAIGAYTVHNAMLDIWFMLLFGVIGYVFKKLDYPLAPLVLALVLGDRAEDSFRQTMLISQGDMRIFYSNWLVGGITALALVMLFWPLLSRVIGKLRGAAQPAAAAPRTRAERRSQPTTKDDCHERHRSQEAGNDHRRRHAEAGSSGEIDRQAQETDGFQLVIDALKLNGIDTIFGLPGIPITDLTRKLQRAGLRVISFRHEQNAGYAASIAGFMTGKPGICLTVSAPGFLNGLDGARQRHHQLLSDDPHQRLERARDRRPAAGRLRGDGPARHRQAARQGRVPRPARRGHRRGRGAGDPRRASPAVRAASISTCRPSCSRRRSTRKRGRTR